MRYDVMEFPVDEHGRLVGYQAGKFYRTLEYRHAREERKYQQLYRALEVRNAYAISREEGRRVERVHRKKPLEARPLVSTPKDPWRLPRALRARRAYDRNRWRAANPLVPLPCRWCDVVFTPRNANRLYCSERCKVQSALERKRSRRAA